MGRRILTVLIVAAMALVAVSVHYWRWPTLAAGVLLVAAAAYLPARLSPDRRYRAAAAVQDRLAAEAQADQPSDEPMPAETEDVLREEMARRGVVRLDEDSFRIVSGAVRSTLDRVTTAIPGSVS